MASHYSASGPLAFVVVAGALVLFENTAGPQKSLAPKPIHTAAASTSAPVIANTPTAPTSKTTSATLPVTFPVASESHGDVALSGDYSLQGIRLEEIRLQQIADNFNSRVEMLDATPSFKLDIDKYTAETIAKIEGIIAHQNEALSSATIGESETVLRRALLTQAQKQLFIIKAFKDEQAACGDARFDT